MKGMTCPFSLPGCVGVWVCGCVGASLPKEKGAQPNPAQPSATQSKRWDLSLPVSRSRTLSLTLQNTTKKESRSRCLNSHSHHHRCDTFSRAGHLFLPTGQPMVVCPSSPPLLSNCECVWVVNDRCCSLPQRVHACPIMLPTHHHVSSHLSCLKPIHALLLASSLGN